jgi:hypothetical protein
MAGGAGDWGTWGLGLSPTHTHIYIYMIKKNINKI